MVVFLSSLNGLQHKKKEYKYYDTLKHFNIRLHCHKLIQHIMNTVDIPLFLSSPWSFTSNEQRSIKKLVPWIRHTRQAPVAAVLRFLCSNLFFHGFVSFSVYGRVPILPVICQPTDVQIHNWGFHLFQDILQSSHLGGILGEISLVKDWLSFFVAPPSWIPLASPAMPWIKIPYFIIHFIFRFIWSTKLINNHYVIRSLRICNVKCNLVSFINHYSGAYIKNDIW